MKPWRWYLCHAQSLSAYSIAFMMSFRVSGQAHFISNALWFLGLATAIRIGAYYKDRSALYAPDD